MKRGVTTNVAAIAVVMGMSTAAGAVEVAAKTEPTLRNGTIGYVLTSRKWAVTQSPDGKVECPNGLNDGNREQFKILYPEDAPKKHLLAESQLEREGQIWHPQNTEEQFVFREAGGKIAEGMDLDGKVDANDFTSPDGVKGVDNQMHRALGCIAGWRGPDGAQMHFENEYMRRYNQNRMLLEITGVDDLVNDPDVTLTTYRGLDELMGDASGSAYISGGTQRIDMRWGKQFIQQFKGKIVDGVLTTDSHDLIIPYSMTFDTSTIMHMQDVRFRLKLTPESAEGMFAGYTDVDEWIRRLTISWSTHHLSYGQVSAPSLYRAMRRLADAKPDPKTGENRAISGTTLVTFRQAYLEHPPEHVATHEGAAPEAVVPARQ
ncbi:MAG: hypothetical protein LCH56_11660 [Proteobacteria bacterium]|nr:hypothetical protein [Pseudomonadota bacterium]